MKRALQGIVLVAMVASLHVHAAAYKGQRVYAKHCVACHGRQEFIGSKIAAQWKVLLDNHGKALAKLHLKSQKAKESWGYFKSKKYTKKSRHLKDFLVEYAKDSGKVPACN
jgi:cytochrome c2